MKESKMELINIDNKMASNFKIIIGSYQRPYVWDREDIENFYKSLKKDKYFGSGTYIERGSNEIEVVDGQQRLITLALLSSHNSLKFNFQFKNYDERLNNIINGNFTDKLDKSKKKDAYLFIIKKHKEYIKDKEMFIEEFNMPFLLIEEKIVIPSFISMNIYGKTVKTHDIYKATLLLCKNTSGFYEVVNDEWINILNEYYYFLFNSNIQAKPPLEALFVQAYNSCLNNKDLNIKKTFISQNFNKWEKKDVNINLLGIVFKYLEWVNKNLRNPLNKEVFNLEMCSVRNYRYLVNSQSTILSFKISKSNFNNKMRNEIFSLMHTINNLIDLFDIKTSSYKSVISNAIKIMNSKEDYYKVLKLLIEFFNNHIEHGIFNDKFEKHMIRFSNNKDNSSNIYNGDCKYLVFYSTFLMNRKKISISKFPTEKIGYHFPDLTIEHILNDQEGNTDIFQLTLCSKLANERLANLKINLKIEKINKFNFQKNFFIINHPLLTNDYISKKNNKNPLIFLKEYSI